MYNATFNIISAISLRLQNMQPLVKKTNELQTSFFSGPLYVHA
jgi:hypothetical protein